MAKLTSAREGGPILPSQEAVDRSAAFRPGGQTCPEAWRINKAGHVITGTLGTKTVEIFAHPDRAIVDFANTSNTPEDIRYFTRKYGVLHRDDLDWIGGRPR